MNKKYIMSIDQGTTGSTVSLVDRNGSLVAQGTEDFPQHFPKPGWVEHNPEDIWQSVEIAFRKLKEGFLFSPDQIAAIGITNQRETALLWHRKTGAPLHNAIVWQCRRTQEFCQLLKKKNLERKIQRKTGLLLDPYFSASKFKWLLDNAKTSQKTPDLALGTVDSFLIWKLSGGHAHVTDVSNASRTMLMNLKTLQWDPELLKIFKIAPELLPNIKPSSGELARTAGVSFLPDGIPITGVAGDQQAALFGQQCFGPGDLKCTFGTGSFLLLNTGGKIIASRSRLLTTVAWQLKGQKPQFALEGSVFVCGAAVQWLRDGLGMIKDSGEIESLASKVTSSEEVTFVPSLTGMGAPYWNPQARGVIVGLTRGSTAAHIARATLESMALQNVDLFLAMEKDSRKKIKSVRVDGGATANNLLMQMQADFSGIEVIRPQQIETTSLGAALLAGLGCGFWSGMDELKALWKIDQKFSPKISPKEKSLKLKQWHKAIKQALLS